MRKWVIMSAGSWMRKPSVEKIIAENNNEGVITAAELNNHGDKHKVFILGSGDSAYGENNSVYNYIRDTGNGHSRGGQVKVENTIIIGEDKVLDEGNGIGLNEKRSLWVFK